MNGTRIAKRFAKLKDEGRSAFVTFMSAGDPDIITSKELVSKLPEAGVDIIELGVPFSDPMADGPAIQLGSQRAIKAGMTVKGVLEMVSDFRKTDDETPIVLMGYFNPLYIYGVDDFVKDAKAAGVDGFIVVDLPPEEESEFAVPAQKGGLDFIYLATPTADEARLKKITEHASGFVYYVSITGVTGTASAQTADVSNAVEKIRSTTDLPVAIGFGINNPEQAQAMASVSDGAVVGSAIVKKIAENLDGDGKPVSGLVDSVIGYVQELAHGVQAAKS